MLLPSILNDAILEYLSTQSQKSHKKSFLELSQGYRTFQNKELGTKKEHVEAYLLGRFPLTWAVLVHLLTQLKPYLPENFSVVDFGSGPATALCALSEVFDKDAIEYLGIEAKQPMIDAGQFLASRLQIPCKFVLQHAEKATVPKKNLAIASYLLNELQNEELFFETLLNSADHFLVVEPGTTDGYQRLMRLRDKVIHKGYFILSPCPHTMKCPMPSGKWCHFSLRVPRTKMLRALKEGTLGYEDEKYSYLIFSKNPIETHKAVIVDKPHDLGFGKEFYVCSTSGDIEKLKILKKDKEVFKECKKKTWGDFF